MNNRLLIFLGLILGVLFLTFPYMAESTFWRC